MSGTHVFKNFVVIHTVKGFSIVSEAEVDVILEFPCFLHDLTYVDNLISESVKRHIIKRGWNIHKYEILIIEDFFKKKFSALAFLKFPFFSYDPTDVGNLISAFYKLSLYT